MKKLKCFSMPMVMVGILLLSGYVSLGYASNSTSASALGSVFQADKIPAGKAVVYIYRPRTRLGKISFNVKANDRVLATLVPSGYYAYITEPGRIEFTAFDSGSSSSVTVDAIAGQAYYLKGVNGKWGGSVHLKSVSPEAGASEIVSCKLITTILGSTLVPASAIQQAVPMTNVYGEKIFVGKIEYTSRLGLHIPPGRTLRLSSDNGDKLIVFISNDIVIRDMHASPTRIGEKAEVKYSSAANGDNEAISFRYVSVDYAQKPTELVVTTQGSAAATSATQMVLQKPTSSYDVQVPVSVAVGIKTVIGTVESVKFIRGGMGSADLKLYILTDDGGKNEFYVRGHNSMFITADGQHKIIMQLPANVYLRKKVKIEYSVIEDATGGLRLENGNNGVVLMSLVD